ncbi:hypothetical protein GFS60_06863 (plasmid) [Rhodococcus sp. WAY2]|nr:hypothetical protein GFS60_06863 [Rhodococcus sp. WAY2]
MEKAWNIIRDLAQAVQLIHVDAEAGREITVGLLWGDMPPGSCSSRR